MRTPILLSIAASLVASLPGCGNVTSTSPDAPPPDAAVPDAIPGEICTPSSPGSAPADENGDGRVDEDCAWHFGTPHWLPAFGGTAFADSYLEPNWVSVDGLRLYLTIKEGSSPHRLHVARRADRSAPFGPAEPLTGIDLADYDPNGIVLSGDEREAFVVATKVAVGGKTDVYRMVRPPDSETFGALAPVPELSTPDDEEQPTLSADGREIIVPSRRRLRRAVRGPGEVAFGTAAPITSLPDAETNWPALTRDGRSLFFYALLPGSMRYRLYRADRSDATSTDFGTPIELTEIEPSGTASVFYPVLSESTRELFFGSDQAWSPTRYAIWRAELCRDGACSKPIVDCPAGGFRSPDALHCYSALPTAMPWSDAEMACQTRGGHLASISSAAEQALIFSRFGANRWIGGFDAARGVPECNTRNAHNAGATWPCAFGWSSGERWTFASWGAAADIPAEPNENGDADEDCAMIWEPAQAGRWNDAICASSLTGICEVTLYPTW